MNPKIVLGLRERKVLPPLLGRHFNGGVRPRTALSPKVCRSQRGRDPVQKLLPDRTDDAIACLKHHRANRRRGRQPNEAIDLLLAGPPPWEQHYDTDGNPDGAPPWSPEKVDDWVKATVDFVTRMAGPESIVLQAWLHCDEKSPHIHVLLVPRQDDRISWKAVRTEFACAEAGRKQRSMHHSIAYATFRESYYQRVGKQFGLERGDVWTYDDKKNNWNKFPNRLMYVENREKLIAQIQARMAEEKAQLLAEQEELEKGKQALAAERERQAADEARINQARQQQADAVSEHQSLLERVSEAREELETTQRKQAHEKTQLERLERNADAQEIYVSKRAKVVREVIEMREEKRQLGNNLAGLRKEKQQVVADIQLAKKSEGAREGALLGARLARANEVLRENHLWRDETGVSRSARPLNSSDVQSQMKAVRYKARTEAVEFLWESIVHHATDKAANAKAVILYLSSLYAKVGKLWGARRPAQLRPGSGKQQGSGVER